MIKVGQTTTNQTIALPYELNNEGDTSISLNELKGNTTQNGTPTPTSPQQVNVVKGKNIIPYPYFQTTKTQNGVTFTDNGDGTITINGTATAQTTFLLTKTIWSFDNTNILPLGTYTLSMENGNANIVLGCNIYKQDNTTAYYTTTNQNKVTFNITETQSLNAIRIVVPVNITANNLIVKPMLEQGSTATPYLPYNTIQAKVVGKNLFDIQGIVKGRLDNGVLGYESSVTNLTLNADSFSFTTNANYRGVTSDYIAITQGDYVLSSNVLNSNYSVKIACYDSSKAWLQDANYTGLGSETARKFTISNSVKYIRIYFSINSAGSITIGFPQLEQSTTPTTYEPYKSNNYPITLGDIELCKIGTYQDRIYKNNGKWYLEKQVGKVVLNGTENWTRTATNTSGQYYFYVDNVMTNVLYNNSNVFSGMSNIGITSSAYQRVPGIDTIYYNNTSNRTRIYTEETKAMAVDGFKTWLSTHNTIVYYALATPTTTEITDETLLEQLEAIGELYRGTNNIMITDTIAPVENIIIEKSNAEFDLVPYIKREPKLDYIDRKGDTGYTADGHYFENIIARKRGLEFELIPMSQENYLSVISHFIDKTQIPVYIDDLFTGETNLIQTYKKEKIPTKQITENGIVRGTTIKLEEI